MKLDLYRFFSVKNVTVTFLEMNRSVINSSFDFKPVVWSLIHPVVSYLEVAMDSVEHMKPCTYYSCQRIAITSTNEGYLFNQFMLAWVKQISVRTARKVFSREDKN